MGIASLQYDSDASFLKINQCCLMTLEFIDIYYCHFELFFNNITFFFLFGINLNFELRDFALTS